MIILLLIFITKRRKKNKLLEVEPEDDIRENVVFYDEEGAGEQRNIISSQLWTNFIIDC